MIGQAEPLSADVSVIIPAHNESLLIQSCLRRVLDQVTTQSVEIIVIANGCSDDTAAQATAMTSMAVARGMRLTVLEQVVGSKPAALNLGDQHAVGSVLIYLDADVCISENAVEEVARVLKHGPALLSAPRLQVMRARSWVTRAYGRIWSELPVVRREVMGCGLYALSRAGRSRWTSFPAVLSDDKFVRLHFNQQEQVIADAATFGVQMPEGLRELVRVRGRWCRGNQDLARKYPHLTRLEPNRIVQAAGTVVRRPALWPSVPVFVLAFLMGELLARLYRRRGVGVWERAQAAREQLAAPVRG